ncbi:hypothetical protein [Streptosporangium pseudovulgare]|uniref:Uncharacterized protein n=1 Tax=Streptosporangium pseudovulgare TaxID=35765 RepID=A0ABQ2QRN9_9ACTN|nr:hypothetical protein [Streptosporangium pseudovulgare]GGP94169.1 hypothetical protein GCM10010140_24910 [Streptosporangium pseudovulgare]
MTIITDDAPAATAAAPRPGAAVHRGDAPDSHVHDGPETTPAPGLPGTALAPGDPDGPGDPEATPAPGDLGTAGAPRTGPGLDPTGDLEALAEFLERRGLLGRVRVAYRRPPQPVRTDPELRALTEEVRAASREESWWQQWSWTEPIAPADEASTAAEPTSAEAIRPLLPAQRRDEDSSRTPRSR